jgi:hypothetical protein
VTVVHLGTNVLRMNHHSFKYPATLQAKPAPNTRSIIDAMNILRKIEKVLCALIKKQRIRTEYPDC